MFNYNKALDLVRRRLGSYVAYDNVSKVYMLLTPDDKVNYTVIIPYAGDFLRAATIETKYKRVFSDYCDTVNITVLNETDYFKPKRDEFIIFTRETGFR